MCHFKIFKYTWTQKFPLYFISVPVEYIRQLKIYDFKFNALHKKIMFDKFTTVNPSSTLISVHMYILHVQGNI
jgi:hypothetical protein